MAASSSRYLTRCSHRDFTGLPSLSAEQEANLQRLAMLSDEDIDLSDMPEVTDWSGAIRGSVLPSDATVSTNLVSPSIIARFQDKAKKTGGNYQDMINDALEEYLLDH
ncbi:hypothetical protein [Psychrobacter sp. CAL346-MNA-CIBAN-0220]|uniref:hypothetical protein n=1 Tax=Psychrobacter sp. CAL346-MNA-CIBAN-0220 TaxID=3140457 RepID=UPI003318B5E5